MDMETNTRQDMMTLLNDLVRQRDTAHRRYVAAEDDRKGRDATPLDAARIEYNRGEWNAYKDAASRLHAIIDTEAGRLIVEGEKMRGAMYR